MITTLNDGKCLQDAVDGPLVGEVTGHCGVSDTMKGCNMEQCPYWRQGAGRYCKGCDLDTGGGGTPQVEDDPRQTTIDWDKI